MLQSLYYFLLAVVYFFLLHMILVAIMFQKMLVMSQKLNILKPRSTVVRHRDIVVIETNDDFLYHFAQLTCNPYFTSKEENNDYNYTFFPNRKLVKGDYLDLNRETKSGELYYVDERSIAIISYFCVVGLCPDLETVVAKKNRKK